VDGFFPLLLQPRDFSSELLALFLWHREVDQETALDSGWLSGVELELGISAGTVSLCSISARDGAREPAQFHFGDARMC
jgi:hypothetical protein